MRREDQPPDCDDRLRDLPQRGWSPNTGNDTGGPVRGLRRTQIARLAARFQPIRLSAQEEPGVILVHVTDSENGRTLVWERRGETIPVLPELADAPWITTLKPKDCYL